ncbi:hypothetical protein SYNPS1DRAFT_28433 [Syncephalis pseudoplumigaleata]|uniref:Armadillo-type protein n=1 Tax=Syncephalis pseudoplumigaleata TaxID=1712513 RepID=A0A4P9Z243_9FUNG|nr:hypothetical protein SYNPS1DRAFT_28433 [Syncephalis pseudoplumigaleata]|eukprot:RKP25841.1 hypothetical protein SYNPS1DRAFT_28433 [Syncephalis pseudoplumigaleata]
MGEAEWTRTVIDTLCGAIDQTRNYKVRIHACTAIRALPERASFGGRAEFVDVVNCIVKALRSAATTEDATFTEYKYMQPWQQQLNDCGVYLLSLATEEDRHTLTSNIQALTALLPTSSDA